jgi:hypothetical protein
MSSGDYYKIQNNNLCSSQIIVRFSEIKAMMDWETIHMSICEILVDNLLESSHLEQKGSGRITLYVDLSENASLRESSEDHVQ